MLSNSADKLVKKKFQDLSIHQKLMVIVALMTIIAMGLSSVVILFWQEVSLTRFMVKELETTADILGSNGAVALRFKVAGDAQRTLSSLAAKSHIMGARFYNEKKEPFAEYSRDGAILTFSEFPLVEGHDFTFSRVVLVKQIYQDGDLLGFIKIVSDLDNIYDHMIDAIFTAILIIMFCSLLSIWFSFKFLHTISNPISTLLNMTNMVSQNKNYSLRAEVFADDDLGKLSKGFNSMLEQIELRDADLQSTHDELEERLAEQKKAEEKANLYAIELAQSNKDLKESQKKMQFIAFNDSLTGLPNRNLVKDRFEQISAHSSRNNKKMAIFYMDLDHFKNLNDTQGHLVGDQFLVIVAELLKSTVRKEDTVGRLGGDEFVVLLGGLDHEDEAISLAKKIIEKMKCPFEINGYEFYSGISIGVSFFPDEGKDMTTTFKNADIAMYQAKRKGRNNYQLFTPSMNEKLIHRVKIEQDLHKAIERNELFINYQPKFELATGNFVGLEALVRWQQFHGEIFYPDQFIPIAEEGDLIFPLGEWVLNSVCQQIKTWKENSIHIPKVAVNLSGRQIERLGLVKMMTKALDQYGLEPELIEMEITETSLMHVTSTVVKTLNELKAIGIHLTIDDFGSGYTSLMHLTSLPIQSLKIDKTFIGNFRDKSNHAIIRSVITLCKDLGLTVIAEGVETHDQLAFLRENNCDQYQGYLSGPPVSPDEIVELIQPKDCTF